MNKRGQFLLIGALIVAGALFSITSVINSAKGGEAPNSFYSLSNEIDYEGNRVLDWGVFNGDQDIEQELTTKFFTEYAAYIQQDKVLFLVGNPETEAFKGYYFKEVEVGTVTISTGGQGFSEEIDGLIKYAVTVQKVNNDKYQIQVTIDGVPYMLKLNKGQNFFFVIVKGENNEQFVATG